MRQPGPHSHTSALPVIYDLEIRTNKALSRRSTEGKEWPHLIDTLINDGGTGAFSAT